MVFITAIADSILDGDGSLDQVIAAYLRDQSIPKTPTEWRLENYALLRGWAYPPQADYLDAMAKIHSGDKVLVSVGWAELRAYYQACLAVKMRFPKPEPEAFDTYEPAELQAAFVNAIQVHLDQVAAARGYGDPDGRFAMLSCCTYAASQHPRFGADGRAAVAWRDEVWQAGRTIEAAVLAGHRIVPSLEELIGELPVMVWPEVQA